MYEHFTREEISGLLEDSGRRPEVLAHLTCCEPCRHEFEQMNRMRMAMSGMSELEPPAGQWGRIEARLDERAVDRREAYGSSPAVGETESGRAGGVGRRPRQRTWLPARRWALQAAAVLALFAGGLAVGVRMPSSGTSLHPQDAGIAATTPLRGQPDVTSASVPTPVEAGYLRAVAELNGLRMAALGRPKNSNDPEWMAEQVTRLEALAEAAREALRKSPADPLLNNFLFQVEDDRNSMASQLDETLRLTTLEYR